MSELTITEPIMPGSMLDLATRETIGLRADLARSQRRVRQLERGLKHNQERWAWTLWKQALADRDSSLCASSVEHYHREAERLLRLTIRLQNDRRARDNGGHDEPVQD